MAIAPAPPVAIAAVPIALLSESGGFCIPAPPPLLPPAAGILSTKVGSTRPAGFAL